MKRYALLGAALVVLLLHARLFDHTCDDAFISFRYAHMLASGQGLVFNAGERVMGYSDLLWVLLLAALELVKVTPLVAARVLGVVFAGGTLAVLDAHLRRAGRDPRFAVAFLALNATYAMWVFGGLEGHLFTFLLTLAVVLATERRAPALAGLALGLATATRPEGFLFLAPFALYLFRDRAYLARLLAPALALLFAQLIFVRAYYGDWVPNTYYAKSEPLELRVLARGAALAWEFVLAYAGVPLVIVALGARELRRSPLPRAQAALPLYVIAAFVAFWLRVGGDVLVLHRLWLPTLPMLALLVPELRVRRPEIVGALFALSGLLAWREVSYLRKDDANLALLRRASERMRAWPKDTVLAANVIGVIGYGSELRVVDMLGLTDAHVARAPKGFGLPAHESHDARYVLARRPDVIIPAYPLMRPPGSLPEFKPLYPSDFDLLEQPELARDYELTTLSFPEGELTVYAKRAWLISRR